VQFHPESILTREGKRLVDNWLKVVAAASAAPARGDLAGSAERAPLREGAGP
jgi:hypothetical protein